MLKLITAPSSEPITLAEAKQHARVTDTDDDVLIENLIAAARGQAEHRISQALITQTWEMQLPAFTDSMDMDLAPVASIVSIKYLDPDGAEQTLDSALYQLMPNATPPRVVLAPGQAWPSTQAAADAVRIRFIAGYGDTAADVPHDIRVWIMVRIASLYAQREAFMAGLSVAEMPGRYVDALLDKYRIPGL